MWCVICNKEVYETAHTHSADDYLYRADKKQCSLEVENERLRKELTKVTDALNDATNNVWSEWEFEKGDIKGKNMAQMFRIFELETELAEAKDNLDTAQRMGRDVAESLKKELAEARGLWAEGFSKGVESIQWENPSGCACRFEDDRIVQVCLAHKELIESKIIRPGWWSWERGRGSIISSVINGRYWIFIKTGGNRRSLSFGYSPTSSGLALWSGSGRRRRRNE